MNKIIITSFAIVGLFAFANPTFASQCGDPSLNHGVITVTDPITLEVSTIPAVDNVACGNGSPENIIRPWGKNSDVPHMKAGETVTDEVGISYTCPEFIRVCLDITHTEYYRIQMRTIVSQLQTSGFLSQFPQIQGWVGK